MIVNYRLGKDLSVI